MLFHAVAGKGTGQIVFDPHIIDSTNCGPSVFNEVLAGGFITDTPCSMLGWHWCLFAGRDEVRAVL